MRYQTGPLNLYTINHSRNTHIIICHATYMYIHINNSPYQAIKRHINFKQFIIIDSLISTYLCINSCFTYVTKPTAICPTRLLQQKYPTDNFFLFYIIIYFSCKSRISKPYTIFGIISALTHATIPKCKLHKFCAYLMFSSVPCFSFTFSSRASIYLQPQA